MRYIYSEERLPIPENGEQAIRPLLFEVIERGRRSRMEDIAVLLGVLGRCRAGLAAGLFARKTAATFPCRRGGDARMTAVWDQCLEENRD